MFDHRIPLMKLYGFKVRLHWSWFIVFVLVTWYLSTHLYPENVGSLAGEGELPAAWSYWAMGAAGALGLFLSILLHELGHAMVARRHGLNIRGITLFFFGGVAEMESEPPSAGTEFQVAIAGPLVSIALAVLAWALGAATYSYPVVPVGVPAVLFSLGALNLVVVIFNMVPAFPLDGGRVLRSAIWRWKGDVLSATRVTALFGSAFGIFLAILGGLQVLFSRGDLGAVFGGIWFLLIGLFLRGAARASYHLTLLHQMLQGERIERLMRLLPPAVPPTLPLRDLVDEHMLKTRADLYPVAGSGGSSIVRARTLRRVSPKLWGTVQVGEIAEPWPEERTVSVDAAGEEALTKLLGTGSSRLLVTENGTVKGTVSLPDLTRFSLLKAEMRGARTEL